MKVHAKQIASILLSGCMVSSFASASVFAFAETKQSGVNTPVVQTEQRFDTVNAENVTGKVDLTAVALNQLSKSVLENSAEVKSFRHREGTLLVTLGEGLAEKAGDTPVAEYEKTKEGRRVIREITSMQSEFYASLRSRSVSYTPVSSYTTLVNAVAIKVHSSRYAEIKGIEGVKSAEFSATYKTAAVSEGAVENPLNVYETGIYNSEEYVRKGLDGRGITVAVLDSGFDYTHDAFQNEPIGANFTYTFTSDFKAAQHSLAHGVSLSARDVCVSKKIPFAYDYADDDADVYPSYNNHGTHVSGIIGGYDEGGYENKKGEHIDKPFSGVAPEVQLVLCKVFTDDLESKDIGGATTEDIVDALEDCTKLGVDLVNMSLGSVAGFSNFSPLDGDSEGQLLKHAYAGMKNAGISLFAAASNEYSSGFGSEFGTNLSSNPDSGTVGSPSTFEGAMSVASINGQYSPYFKAGSVNDDSTLDESGAPVFFLNSSDPNMVEYDFVEQMLGSNESGIFKYVMVPGTGRAVDYTSSVKNQLRDKSKGKVIAVVRRGNNTFKEKIEIARENHADAVIVYNNVAGTVRMNLGEIVDPENTPSISVTMDAGADLNRNVKSGVGYIRLDKEYQAGPFMNDYSSWGVTPDLRLKPDITSHGGEITSSVPGNGYAEQSGTSMATPNLAGFAALLRSYLKQNAETYFGHANVSATELTTLTNQLLMSTAECVYDQLNLPVSPRKQGAGLAVLDHLFTVEGDSVRLNTAAYLSDGAGKTEGAEYREAEDRRPKAELSDDKEKKGVYYVKFTVNNIGGSALTFTPRATFMTETLSSDKLSVAERAYLLDDVAPEWSVLSGGATLSDGVLSVPANSKAVIEVKLSLSAAEKRYIDTSFKNGMFVEGFLKLESAAQCSLTLPFVGFYGDWEDAPLLDYDCYEIAASEKDMSVLEEDKLKPSVWATQAFASYYNDTYSVPMGSFLYLQDEDADQIYTEEEHAAISCFNNYYGVDNTANYLTSTSLKALYAGLLRNCELATYRLYDDYTGELLKEDSLYRLNKAYSGGGSSVPSQLLLEMYPEEMGFAANGKYRLEFDFFRTAEEAEKAKEENDGRAKEENTFGMIFYVDYEAPILVDQRIRYYDYKDGTKDKQRVYLDLDIYDNHYAQSVMLCCVDSDEEKPDYTTLRLATEYVTPIYNARKNGTSSVSIEITDIYEEYNGRLYIQIDDYALNHSVYRIDFATANASVLPTDFSFVADEKLSVNSNGDATLTLEKNEAYKVALDYEGSANVSNFNWYTFDLLGERIRVKNGEIFAVAPGTEEVRVTTSDSGNLLSVTRTITVTVVDSNKTLSSPSLSFGVIKNGSENLVKASGIVEVNPGSDIRLQVMADPWYYSLEGCDFTWSVPENNKFATVDSTGLVHIKETEEGKRGSVTVSVEVKKDGRTVGNAAVTFAVVEPYTYAGGTTLTSYHGDGGKLNAAGERVLYLPDDKNIMTIGEEAFRDNEKIEVIVLPKTVREIRERAFVNCPNLKRVSLIKDSKDSGEVTDEAELFLIYRDAFKGCNKLETLDLTYSRVITVAQNSFADTPLKEIVHMEKIGTAYDGAFRNTKLTTADITGMHVAGADVFRDCKEIVSVKTAYYTAIGTRMFYGCEKLQKGLENGTDELIDTIRIYAPKVGDGAFENSGVVLVSFIKDANYDYDFEIGAAAFRGTPLESVDCGSNIFYAVGDEAFAYCSKLDCTTLASALKSARLGSRVFSGTKVAFDGAVYDGDTLVLAPARIDGAFVPQSGTLKIGSYAFADSKFAAGASVDLTGIEEIGEGAFEGCSLASVTLPSLAKIPAFAFRNSALTSITIPSSVEAIGESAFEGSSSLVSVTFAPTSALKEIGSRAFARCTRLKTTGGGDSFVLPDGAGKMGSFVFADCTALVNVTLPSVTELGGYTFSGCSALASLTYGANATTTGVGTCSAVIFGVNGNQLFATSLSGVTLGENIRKIENFAFAGCTSLTAIDLKSVTEVGEAAFFMNSALQSVAHLDRVRKFGAGAFAGTAMEALTLTAAEEIGDSAFAQGDSGLPMKYTEITLSEALKTIAPFAFYGGKESGVIIPKGVTSIGESAFCASENLTAFTVDADNKNFFALDGVLYRTLSEGRYELVSYPTARGVREYRVSEGTASILDQAFARLKGNLKVVTLPYTVKTIGDSAFYLSGVEEYVFECIDAPVLLSSYRDTGVDGFFTLFYENFEDGLFQHTPAFTMASMQQPVPSHLTIRYPSNGVGYDNYLYAYAFGTKIGLGELINDETRTLKNMLISLPAAGEVSGWNGDNHTKAEVEAFSDTVKEAHRLYNNVKSESQLAFLKGADEGDLVAKLFAVELALKPVKQAFGIPVRVTSVSIDTTSPYKSEYKVGERFDMSGLKLVIHYDDYSFVNAQPSDMTLGSAYGGALTELNQFVIVECAGKDVIIPVTVTAVTAAPSEPSGGEEEEGGCNSSVGVSAAVTAALLAIVGTVFAIKVFKRSGNHNDED